APIKTAFSTTDQSAQIFFIWKSSLASGSRDLGRCASLLETVSTARPHSEGGGKKQPQKKLCSWQVFAGSAQIPSEQALTFGSIEPQAAGVFVGVAIGV